MQALYIEGPATHDDPKPCVGDPRGRSEALVGAHTGRLMSRENVRSGCRRRRLTRKATSPAASSQVAGGPRAVGEPEHVWNLYAREPGDPAVRPPIQVMRAARRRLWPHVRDVRAREVGLPRSTCEATEQSHAHGCGGGGGKAAARGEHGQQTVVRTQRRARHVTCAGSCASAGSSRRCLTQARSPVR